MSSAPQDISDFEAILGHLFSSAREKYEALVAAQNIEGFSLTETVSGYTDTLACSEIEAEIFGLDPLRIPALFWAYERYENLIGSMDAYFGEYTDQERIDHAAYYLGEREWSFDKALGFMVNVCHLPAPQCRGWLCKIIAANIRGGL